MSRWSPTDAARFAAPCAAAAVVPPLLAFAALSQAMTAAEAFEATLGSWPHVLGGDVAGQFFYRNALGTLALEQNLTALAAWSVVWGGFAAVLFAAGRPWGGGQRGDEPVGRVVGAASFVFGFGLVLGVVELTGARLVEATRPLPLFLLVLLIVDLVRLTRHDAHVDPDGPRRAARATFAAFALVLLAKVALRARIDQYGFALAMPGALLAATVLIDGLPRLAARRGAAPNVVRAAAMGGLFAVVLALLTAASQTAQQRSFAIGEGSDRFRAGLEGPVIAALLEALEARAPEDATLAALPEGVMLNYLSRRANPTGHINFMPPEFAMFGERAIGSAFGSNPPDYIAIVHKDTREYGVGFFGQRSYGRALSEWVRTYYRPVERFGEPPLVQGTRFGILLLERAPRDD